MVEVSMKQHGDSMKFSILFEHSSSESKELNIHDFVIVRFKIDSCWHRDWDCYKSCIHIAMKKHEYAKDWTFTVNVTCNMLQYNVNTNCSENWPDWKSLNEYGTKKQFVEVYIKINIIQTYSIVNKKNHDDETYTDFQLSADDGSVAVHRLYLASNSDVFANIMLQGQWKETAQGRVELKGVTRQTLQHFKDFMYLGTLPDDDDGLCPLLLLATRYLVESLRRGCMMKLMQTITAENLDSHIEFALVNQMHELKDNILEKISGKLFASAYAIKINALMGKKESSSLTDVLDSFSNSNHRTNNK